MITIDRVSLTFNKSRGVGPIFRRADEWRRRITFTDGGRVAVVESTNRYIIGVVTSKWNLLETAFGEILRRRGWQIEVIDDVCKA